MCSGKNEKRAHLFLGKLMCELKLEIITKIVRALGKRNHLNHDGVDCNKIGCLPEKLVSDVLFLEVFVILCIISKKNVTFVMRSLLK